ncbi:M48 family metallopeptidase [Candidatus Saccharibacteria bacterium]|nr:M48 family metallopeptidase [Candidatus Saccharibacteria bacterium]
MERQISANNFKTGVLFALVIFLFLLAGGIVGVLAENYAWAAVILVAGVVYTAATYRSAAKRVIKLNGAQEATRRSHRQLYLIVENLSITLGIKTPEIYVIDDPALNAFAAGHTVNKSIIGVTTGLLGALDRKELEGVMAHELSHIVNRDVRVASIIFALVAGIGLMAYLNIRSGGGRSSRGNSGYIVLAIIAVSILLAVLAFFARMAISRRREYLADVTGAQITRYPEGLASALEKISLHGSRLQKSSASTAHFFLESPVKSDFLARFLSTHPPIEDRIARLRQLEAAGY